MNGVKHWSFAGVIVITILGFVLHYVYSWSSNSKIVGMFVPVNESVWEHLKLGLWGTIFFSFIEYQSIGKSVGNYFILKAMGILVLSLSITIVFYSYTHFTGESVLLIDISSYVLGVLFSQFIFYKFHQSVFPAFSDIMALLFITGTCLIFAIFTFNPPHKDIFRDHNTNTFGINWKAATS